MAMASSTTEVAELEDAARAFLAQYGDVSHPTPETFVVPSLQPKLEALSTTLIHGIGFEVIRGVPVDRVGVELASTIFFGIGAHLGSARSQTRMDTCWVMSATSAPTAGIPTSGSIRRGNVKPSTRIRRM